ncbi:MAG TPA: SDR family oxidoreductase [Thermoleophilaceae bacterium]|nr:SDR family oxidoreductase [Thermoleophilaceae bacterium]
MLLEDENAVIYGGGGSIGGAVAKGFAREGATVFLAGSSPLRDYYLGGTQVAFDAIETIRRQLSVELGPHGIRVVTLGSGGVPESMPEGFAGRAEIVEMLEKSTLLGRAATLEEIGNVAAFVASDRARSMTAATVNVSGGALMD